MKRLAWATDIHLNAADEARAGAFLDALLAADPDALLVGGDIGEADSVEGYLIALADRLRRPIYFVLGNHDFYGSRIADVRAAMRALTRSSPWLRWMPDVGVVPLTAETALVGHDGWADGRLGGGARSRVIMNDHLLIGDFTEKIVGTVRGATDVDEWLERFWSAQDDRFALLRALGDEAAAHVRTTVPAALDRYRHVVFLTHVPPFLESCWYQGQIADDEWLPHETCWAVGEALRESMRGRSDRRLTVLCGHTHGEGTADIQPNLVVRTGGARYGRPALQPLIEVE